MIGGIPNKDQNPMKKKTFTLLLALLPLFSAIASDKAAYDMRRTQVIPMHDSASNKQYELYVKLPEKYAEDKSSVHPVIYFTDAVWQIELLSGVTDFMMENAILVGLSWQKDLDEAIIKDVGEYASRFSDYSIRESSDPEMQTKYQFGQASQHLAFIRNDVIKYVEKNFQTDPLNRTYFGYSLGGLFGAYVLSAQPDTFKNYILGSPSLQRENSVLAALKTDPATIVEGLKTNVYITYGTLEPDRKEFIEAFAKHLKTRYEQQISITSVVIEGSHQTAFPLTGVRSVNWLANLSNKGEQQ